MPNRLALLVTVARAHQAATTSINTHQPDFVAFLTTKEFAHNVALVQEATRIPNPTSIHITVHNNPHQTLEDALAALEALQQHNPDTVFADLTSGTTPMSIAVWEACKKTGAVPHWVDNTDNGPVIVRLRLRLPEEE